MKRLAAGLVCGAFLLSHADGAAAWGHGGDAGHAAQGREWTAMPLIVRATGGVDDGQGGVYFTSANFQPGMLMAYAPGDAAPHELPRALAGARLEPLPEVGNYYWVTGREESGGKVTVASTAHYFNKPGPAPTKMLLAQKHELELIPQPLPREHNSYRENEDWKFLLRFNGQPLAGQAVVLETKNGSRASFTSDESGIVAVRFPQDFKEPSGEKAEGKKRQHGPRRAPFVLEAGYAADGKQYVTAFNSTYAPGAYTYRSLALGAGFVLCGMLLASPLLRRKQDDGKGAAC